MHITQAARILRPGTAWNHTGGVLSQADDNTPRVTVPTAEELQTVMDSDTYVEMRVKEYPPVSELADALVHQAAGDSTHMDAYIAKCEAVKAKYPKP